MHLYHGTTDLFLSKIKKQGLKAPDDTGNKCENRITNLNLVFLTDSIKGAEIYARRAIRKFGGSPIILKVNVEAELERAGKIKQYYMTKFIKIIEVNILETADIFLY